MIDPTCSREVIGIIAYMEQTGLPYKVTSTWRPGAITAAGHPSRHGRKLAVDFAGPTPSLDSDTLATIFHAFGPVEHKLNELIYAGPQVSYNIKAGKRVGKYAQAIHHNHVHVAVDPGLILAEVRPVVVVDSVIAPAPEHEEAEDMADPVDAIPDNGGALVLTRDGGVRAYNGARYQGSYPGLPPEQRQGERTFVTIQPNQRGGYDLISAGGERYSFPA